MSAWHQLPDGRWLHRPWWKRAINTPLRWVQGRRPRCLLVYTRVDESTSPPTVLGYGFGWITMDWSDG